MGLRATESGPGESTVRKSLRPRGELNRYRPSAMARGMGFVFAFLVLGSRESRAGLPYFCNFALAAIR